MIPFRRSIGFRLLGITTILLAIPLFVDSFIFLKRQFEATVGLAKSQLVQESNLRVHRCEQVVRQHRETAEVLIHFLDLQKKFPEAASDALNHQLQQLSIINHHEEIVLVRAGKVVGSSLPEAQNQEVDPWIKQLPSVDVEHPMQTGFLTVEEALVIASVYGVDDGVILMMDGVDKVLPGFLMTTRQPYPMEFAVLHEKIGEPWIEFERQGTSYIGYRQRIEGTEDIYLSYAKKRAAFALAWHDFFLVYGTYVFILIVGLVIAYLGTKRLVWPINALSVIMQAIKEGKLRMRYRSDRFGFEINQLGFIFNDTITTLIEKEQAQEEERVRKERLSKELKLGHQVQLQLLPKQVPQVPGVQLSTAFVPAIDVGGDFFDVFVKKGGELVISVADASGKGVQACLYSLTLKNMLKTMALSHVEVHEAMRKANNIFYEDTGDTGMFVTVFMAQYDPKTRLFEHSSCGHNPPMLYRQRTQTIEVLPAGEMAMGFLLREEKKDPSTIQLEKGDFVVLYSDGVTEAHNVDKQLFGEERLMNVIRAQATASMQELTTALMEEISRFAGGAKQHDDITLVAMKALG